MSLPSALPGAARQRQCRDLVTGSDLEAVKMFVACMVFPPFTFPVGKWL